MSKHTTFKIGGKVNYFCQPTKISNLIHLLKLFQNKKIRYEIVGNGSNILFSSKGFCGAVIKIGKEFQTKIPPKIKNYLKRFNENQNEFRYAYYSAGCSLAKLANQSARKGLSGLEFAASIPGTLGGAIVMNAGAFESSISNVIEKVVVLDKKRLRVCYFSQKKCAFEYRKSIFSNSQYIILGAILKLRICDKSIVHNHIERNMEIRKTTQNVGYASAGSVFKRTNNFIPAKFLDENGFKGLQVGKAQLSYVHSGYIVNLGGATSDDVLALVNLIQKKVGQISNFVLELEIKKMGDF